MSDSVRPHRLQPTRLPRPWGSPGKNTGVGCHFLLQCIKVKSESESEVAQSCPTLSDPMDCSLPGSSIHGIFQVRILEWGAIAFSASINTIGFKSTILQLYFTCSRCSLHLSFFSAFFGLIEDLYSYSYNHSILFAILVISYMSLIFFFFFYSFSRSLVGNCFLKN